MNISTVNMQKHNQQTNEQKPSFKALSVGLFPKTEPVQGKLGFVVLSKYLERLLGEGNNKGFLTVGFDEKSKKIVGIVRTAFGSEHEKAVNNAFFNGTARAITNEEVETLTGNYGIPNTFLRYDSKALPGLDELIDSLVPAEEEIRIARLKASLEFRKG